MPLFQARVRKEPLWGGILFEKKFHLAEPRNEWEDKL